MPVIDDTLQAITSIKPTGDFANRAYASPNDLKLHIKGVGDINLPVSARRASQLKKIARPAGFGWREQTLVDKSVRDTWEIAPSRVKIDQRQWRKTLAPELERIKRQFGLPEQGKLKAELHKLLVYEPGQFFAAHQDSEKVNNMVGTLTVTLPSYYEGGSTIVRHHDDKVTYRATAKGSEQLTLVAFYADCLHEVRPIKEGHRVVLVYNLIYEWPASGYTCTVAPSQVTALSVALERYFDTPVKPYSWSKESTIPDKLVYLLDHQYTKRSLAWHRLKNGDAPRAQALVAIAESQDYELYLTLAEVQETWHCEEDWSQDRYYRRHWSDENQNVAMRRSAEGSIELLELIADSIELPHWLNRTGSVEEPFDMDVRPHEVIWTKASKDCDPFESEYEGWMGNYGNTMDRWYHRAAIVIWPRNRTFIVNAKASPDWAMQHIEQLLDEGDSNEALDNAQLLHPFWHDVVPVCAGRGLIETTMRVALKLDDAPLATMLLHGGFALHHLGARACGQFAKLLKLYGNPWCQEILQQWSREWLYYGHEEEKTWIGTLPTLCKKLSSQGGNEGKELAQWVVQKQWPAIEEYTERALKDCAAPQEMASLERLGLDLVKVMEACLFCNEHSILVRIRQLLCGEDSAYPYQALLTLLQSAQVSPELSDLVDHLAPIFNRCQQLLELHLSAPQRAKDDWRMPSPFACTCELCQTLNEFLEHPIQTTFVWPLAQDKRAHIHRQLDRYELSVNHTTRREGRPYKLTLEKTNQLFLKENRERKAWKKSLAEVRRLGRKLHILPP